MNISSNFINKNPLYSANRSGFSVAGTAKKSEKSSAHGSNRAVRTQLRKLSQTIDPNDISDAMDAYLGMQKTLMLRIREEQGKIDAYNELDGKINYYSDLLHQCGSSDRVYADDLKYDLAGSNTPFIARSDIEKYLEDAEARFDNLVNWKPVNKVMEMANSLHAENFKQAAAKFYDATEIDSELLDIAGDTSLINHNEGITKENFVETAEKKIESLKARSNGLSGLMKEYKKKSESGSDELLEEIKSMEKYILEISESIRQNFLLTGELGDAERTRSLLDTLA